MSSFYVNAQKTLVISSDDSGWQDACVHYLSDANTRFGDVNNKNRGKGSCIYLIQWTWDGVPGEYKALINFDLSELPKNAIIKKAYLSLYIDPEDYFAQKLSVSVSKEFVIQRITSAWSEDDVTWNTQPDFTNKHKIIVRDNFSNYDKINVTPIIKDIYQDPDNSFGLMLSSTKSSYYNGIFFASSDNQNADLHPKLTIIYTSQNSTGSAVQQNTTGNVAAEPVNSTDCGNNQNIFVYNTDFELVASENNVSSDRIAEIIGSLSSGNYLIQLISADADVTSFSIKVK